MTATLTSTPTAIFATSSSSSSSSRIVRFESECVLIPETQRTPKKHIVATKTYSVPLWKRRNSGGGFESGDDLSSSMGLSSSPEDTHIVLKLPLPSFNIHSRRRSPTRSPTIKPLLPCIRHTASGHFLVSPSSPIRNRRPRTPTRSPSLPLPTTDRKLLPGPTSPTTIPLRACCPDCFHITEECMKEGEDWKEKFTRGARRRRSSSLDSHDMPIRPPSPTANCAGRILSGLDLPSSGFSAVTCPSKASAAVITSKFAGAGPCRIAVDEVDRKRRSDPPTGCFPPTRTREASYSSIDSESSVASSTGDLYSPSEKPRASPIAEIDEDEDQLFPLPSPRRSPNASPVPGSHRSGSRSPSIRSTNSAPPSPANSIPPSPNGSTSCLNRSGCSSRDSLPSISSVSDEATGPRRKCKRKSSKCEKGFLSPPDSSRARGDLGGRVGEEEEVPILAAPTPRRPRTIPDADDLSTPIASATVFPSSAPSPTSPLRSRSPTTKMRDYDGTPTRTARSISSSSSKRSRSASAQDGKRRRPSFSIPSPSHIFSDMLKGVSSMGGVTHCVSGKNARIIPSSAATLPSSPTSTYLLNHHCGPHTNLPLLGGIFPCHWRSSFVL